MFELIEKQPIKIRNIMKKVKYTERKPTNSDWYFCLGKGNRKSIIYYFAESDEWDYGDLAYNHFNDDEIFWIDLS